MNGLEHKFFGRGVGSIGRFFEVCSLFHSSLSPASLPLSVFSLGFLPSHLSFGFYCPTTTSSILISILPNLTSIVGCFSLYSF